MQRKRKSEIQRLRCERSAYILIQTERKRELRVLLQGSHSSSLPSRAMGLCSIVAKDTISWKRTKRRRARFDPIVLIVPTYTRSSSLSFLLFYSLFLSSSLSVNFSRLLKQLGTWPVPYDIASIFLEKYIRVEFNELQQPRRIMNRINKRLVHVS